MVSPSGCRATARLDVGDARDGCRASAGRAPGRGRTILFQRCPAPARSSRRTRWGAPAGVQYTVLCRQLSSFDEHNTVWGSPGNGVSEKCVTATKQAAETPGGGRDPPRTTNVARRRRAASWSGGAMSAERDRRPMYRRTSPEAATDSEPLSPLPAHRSHGRLIAHSDNSTPSRTSPTPRESSTSQAPYSSMDSYVPRF
jgi:hypothetical protein